MATIKRYTSAAEIMEYWVENISPNYFDLNDISLHRASLFGYTNEVMANAVMDAFNAINLARREFYPTTAKNIQSFYKMAATQSINLPTVVPAYCTGVIVLQQSDVINNSTFDGDVYTCTIDNSMKIYAGDVPFMLDYPITIISKQNGDSWLHTIHYDTTYKNELNTTNDTYIMNRTIMMDGSSQLLLSVKLRQVERYTVSEYISKDSLIETTTINIPFDGDLASFDIFYYETTDSTPVQLQKVLQGGVIPEVPFYYYRMLDSATLQIIFPKNSYFTPKLNSEIEVHIYTSLGKEGEFKVFNGDLSFDVNSDKYPYNNSMVFRGIITSSSQGSVDNTSIEKFREVIKSAYTTNNTITTSADLQKYFDSLTNNSDKNRIIFSKKRDDLTRLYMGCFLLKDDSNNIIPTNTINISLKLSDFDEYNEVSGRAFLKPGTIFEYEKDVDGEIKYDCIKAADISLIDNLDKYDDNSRFLFTNPFLISLTVEHNIIGFYYTAVDAVKALNCSYANDNTIIQFISSSLQVERNPIRGENFYKFSMVISPSTTLDSNTIIHDQYAEIAEDDTTTIEQYRIRAKADGQVISTRYDETKKCIVSTVKYVDGSTQEIINNTYSTVSESGSFVYNIGYTMNFKANDTFTVNDILAEKKITDLGKIRIALDFKNNLFPNELYVPMYIDSYNSEDNSYTVCGYIGTSDILNLNATMVINHGVYNSSSNEALDVNLNMNELQPVISIFYKDDTINYSHKYNNFNYFKGYTLTNEYSTDSTDMLALVQQIDFIRSTVIYKELIDPIIENDFGIVIKEVPVAKANWLKYPANFTYMTNTIHSNYLLLKDTYYYLENNFGIDMKFFNTYGKSKYYNVGNGSTVNTLDNVNCSLHFGIYLNTFTTQSSFLEEFRAFVKEYIEQINSVDSNGKSIYIMNLISEIRTQFPEIGYIEYYGLNKYGFAAQRIEAKDLTSMTSVERLSYIPEFVNIYTVVKDGVNIPKIDVTFLSK